MRDYRHRVETNGYRDVSVILALPTPPNPGGIYICPISLIYHSITIMKSQEMMVDVKRICAYFTPPKGNSVCPVRLQSIIRASRAIAQRLGSANNSPKPARSARSRDLLKATFELKPRIPAFCSVRRRTAL